MGTQKGKKAVRVAPDLALNEPSSGEPVMDRAVQERIGTHLRAMYDDLMQQPVPDRFAELLGQLDRQGKDQAR